MLEIKDVVLKRKNLAIEAFSRLEVLEKDLFNVCELIVGCLKNGKKILVCGNGGSAAEAQHFTTELVGRFRTNRMSLPALSLTADGVALTCIANDFGWDAVFSRQIEGLYQEGDIVFCISTSGKSGNIIGALNTAKNLGLMSVALLGNDGGNAVLSAGVSIIAPGSDTASIQEVHLWVIHTICEAIEVAFPMK